jgi:hypothetical protein
VVIPKRSERPASNAFSGFGFGLGLGLGLGFGFGFGLGFGFVFESVFVVIPTERLSRRGTSLRLHLRRRNSLRSAVALAVVFIFEGGPSFPHPEGWEL